LYEKQSGSEDSQPDGSQRLRCTLCPGKSFKDNNRLKIHVDKYHVDNNTGEQTIFFLCGINFCSEFGCNSSNNYSGCSFFV
jgi:hypothetical protein